MFQDALRSARSAQRLIVLTAAIVSLFALSIVPVDDLYLRARTQIGTAMSIDWSDYDRWVETRLEPIRDSRVAELKDRDPNQRYDASGSGRPIAEAWELLGSSNSMYGPISNRDQLTAVWGELNVAILTAARWRPSPTSFGAHDSTTPLDLLRFFASSEAEQDARLYSVSVENAQRAIWSRIADLIIRQDRYEGVSLLASSVTFRANAGLLHTRWTAASDEETNVEGVVHCSIRAAWIVDRPGYVDRSELAIEPDEREVTGTSIVGWLQDRYPNLGMVDEADGEFVPFFGLEHVWREIADRPLTDADLYLSALAAEERRRGESVTVLGVAVPAALVPIAGPLALLGLLVHLSRLVAHVRRRAGGHREELLEFAWPVLHAGRAWWADPLISLVAFPLATQIVIAVKLRDAEPTWVDAGWLVMGLTMVAAIVTWRQLAALRRVATAEDVSRA